MRAIGAALAGLDVEVVAFQEVWTASAVDSLTQAGLEHGFEHAWSSSGAGARGGLLVLSTLRIAAARFETYALGGLPERVWDGDYQAGKGFCELDMETPEGRVVIFATHLVSQYAPDAEDAYWAHRMAQVVQLSRRVQQRGEPVVAVGDFNFREDQPHHAVLLGLAGLRDAAADLSRREPTSRSDNPYRRASRPQPDARIDYVFARSGLQRSVGIQKIESAFDGLPDPGRPELAYSDHAGLRAEFALAEPGAPLPDPHPDAVEAARSALLAGQRAAAERRSRRRWLAGMGVGGGVLALLGARSQALTRRGLLRSLLRSGGALAGGAGLGAAALAELASPDETRALEEALQQLRGRTSNRE